MLRLLPFLSLLFSFLLLSIRADDAPSTSDFLRRAFPAVIVLGDYLYIDGGEVSQLYSGKNGSVQHPSYPMNGTISIPLKTSWTNTSVTFKQSAKSAPLFNQQGIWRHPSGSAFYIWGGLTAYFGQPPPLEIWRFSADGSGGGLWNKETPRGSTVVELSKAVRAGQSAWTQSRNVGYFLGGYANAQSDTSVTGDTYLALPGLLSYDMTSGELTNSSSVGLGPYGNLVSGAAEFVPFGPSGVLLFLGGGQGPIATKYGGWTGVDFNNLTFYDIATKKWHSQQATGARPTRRERFCTVGVAGPNNTYEIFMYGGVDTQASRSSNEVYVLSLPGFVFFKGPTSTPRADHNCALVGRRQMLSVGGTDGYLGFPNSLLDPDPFKNGLAIFDLSNMVWADRYDADAKDYESPSSVKEWYASGGLASVSWSSDEVQKLFAKAAPSNTVPETTHGGGPNGPSETGANPEASSSGSPPVGAIVGGVVGGVAFVAILVAAFFFYRKRAKQKFAAAAAPNMDPTWVDPKPDYIDQWSSGVISAVTPGMTPGVTPQELDGNNNMAELPGGHGASEMLSPHGRSELPHPSRL